MASAWVKHDDGSTGGSPSDANRREDLEDPRGVLLSVERLVLSAGESVRRLRQLESVSQDLGDGWADGGAPWARWQRSWTRCGAAS